MKKEYKLLIVGLIAITLLDGVGSLATLKYNFNYAYLAIVSLLVYLSTGYAVAKIENLKTVSFYGAILGLYDSTIGWKLTMMINPQVNHDHEPTIKIWIATIFFLIVLAAFCAFIGGLLSKVMK